MIRMLAALCLITLPAAAQDFRGLLPGMDMSELARLGEPSEAPRGDPNWLISVDYVIDAEHLSVTYGTDGRILRLVAWRTPPHGPEDFGPTTSFPVTIEDVQRIAGSEGWYFALEGQHNLDRFAPMWRLYYDLPDHPDLVLGLRFLTVRHEPLLTLQPSWDGVLPLNTIGSYNMSDDYQFAISGDNRLIPPSDAQLSSATLFHRDYFAYDPDLYAAASHNRRPGADLVVRIDRPGAAPFATPLSEAFPRTQTP